MHAARQTPRLELGTAGDPAVLLDVTGPAAAPAPAHRDGVVPVLDAVAAPAAPMPIRLRGTARVRVARAAALSVLWHVVIFAVLVGVPSLVATKPAEPPAIPIEIVKALPEVKKPDPEPEPEQKPPEPEKKPEPEAKKEPVPELPKPEPRKPEPKIAERKQADLKPAPAPPPAQSRSPAPKAEAPPPAPPASPPPAPPPAAALEPAPSAPPPPQTAERKPPSFLEPPPPRPFDPPPAPRLEAALPPPPDAPPPLPELSPETPAAEPEPAAPKAEAPPEPRKRDVAVVAPPKKGDKLLGVWDLVPVSVRYGDECGSARLTGTMVVDQRPGQALLSATIRTSIRRANCPTTSSLYVVQLRINGSEIVMTGAGGIADRGVIGNGTIMLRDTLGTAVWRKR